MLSQEDQSLLADFISGDIPADEPQEAPQAVPSDPAEDVQANAEGEGDAGESEVADHSPATEEDPAPGHRVPYNRFKQVLDARNGFKGEIDRLSAELEQARASQATAPAAPTKVAKEKSDSDASWLEDLLKEDGNSNQEMVDKIRAEFGGINERIYQQEVAVAGQQLEIEVDHALASYPSVPREVIYQAVADNPDATALQIAEHYSTQVGGIEEAAIARYIAENGLAESPAAAAPEAAPRVESSGDMEMQGEREATKLLSIEEGTSALRKFLSNNPFG